MLFYNTGYFNKLIEKTTTFLIGRDEIFTQIITSENKKEVLGSALSNLHIPTRLNSVVINIGEKVVPSTNGMSIASFISEALFVGVAIGLAAILLYLLIFIIVYLMYLLHVSIYH